MQEIWRKGGRVTEVPVQSATLYRSVPASTCRRREMGCELTRPEEEEEVFVIPKREKRIWVSLWAVLKHNSGFLCEEGPALPWKIRCLPPIQAITNGVYLRRRSFSMA